MRAPLLINHLGFLKAVGDFSVEQFISELAVEGFTLAILPRGTRFNVLALNATSCQPFAQDLDHHFWTIVGTCMAENAVLPLGVGQGFDDTDCIDPPCRTDGQSLAAKPINERHQPDVPAVMGIGFDKIEAPDMVELMPHSNARTVSKLQAQPFELFLKNFQSLRRTNDGQSLKCP